MATKRLRSSGHWEFIVKRKHLLATPLYLTFDSEAQGDEYVRKLEALLDRGIVPDEFKNDPDQPRTIAEVISRYQAARASRSRSECGSRRLLSDSAIHDFS